MEKISDIRISRFWEKYEVLDKLHQISHPGPTEQFFKLLDDVYRVWHAHPDSQTDIDETLEMKIHRQACLYKLSQKGK